MAELYVKHLPDGTKLQGGKYEIVRFINSGGFGCTYEARFPMMRTRVAIKEFFMGKYCVRDQRTGMVAPSTEESRSIVDRCRQKFVDEASTLYGMSHRSIVRVSDIFEENGTAYFAMDFISGRTLAEIVRDEGPMPEQKAIDCMRQICEALQYLHSRHRLHLDIKPDNIMIDDTGKAVLIDFGASKYLDNASSEERQVTSNVVQTPGYSPNEQLTGDTSRFTNATDLYALGASFYYVLTGVTPVSATLRTAGEDLEPLPESVSEPTRQAVYKAMSLMKADRPQTAAEFSAMLKDVPRVEAPSGKEAARAEQSQAFEPDSKTMPVFAKQAAGKSPFEVKSPSVFDIPKGGKKSAASPGPSPAFEPDKPTNPFARVAKPKPKPAPKPGIDRKIIIGVAAAIGALLIVLGFIFLGGEGVKPGPQPGPQPDTLRVEQEAAIVEEAVDSASVDVEPEGKVENAETEVKPEPNNKPAQEIVPEKPAKQEPAKNDKSESKPQKTKPTLQQEPEVKRPEEKKPEAAEQQGPTPDQLMGEELRTAMRIADLKSRQKALLALAAKGYAPAYAPAASVSVLLHDDANADKYARLAIQSGHASEVQAVVKALDRQGYYDDPSHGKKPM